MSVYTIKRFKAINQRSLTSKALKSPGTVQLTSSSVETSCPKFVNTISNKCHWRLSAELKPTYYPPVTAHITPLRLISSTSVHLANDDLIRDLSPTYSATESEKHPSLGFNKLVKCRDVKETSIVISAPGANSYYHWHFDVLARASILISQGIDFGTYSLFVPSTCMPFQLASLEYHLGNHTKKIQRLDLADAWNFHSAIVPSFWSRSGDPCPRALQFLRSNVRLSSNDQPKRIYIDRSLTSSPRVISDSPIAESLLPLGFVPVQLELLSYSEQISLFSEADFIVAPHGAGLANIYACKPQCKLVEIFSPNYVMLAYRQMASLLNLNYFAFIGDGPGFEPSEYSHDNKSVASITCSHLRDFCASLLC